MLSRDMQRQAASGQFIPHLVGRQAVGVAHARADHGDARAHRVVQRREKAPGRTVVRQHKHFGAERFRRKPPEHPPQIAGLGVAGEQGQTFSPIDQPKHKAVVARGLFALRRGQHFEKEFRATLGRKRDAGARVQRMAGNAARIKNSCEACVQRKRLAGLPVGIARCAACNPARSLNRSSGLGMGRRSTRWFAPCPGRTSIRIGIGSETRRVCAAHGKMGREKQ